MPRAVLRPLLPVVACLLLPAAAAAQPRGRFELTPMVGYRLEGDFDVRDVDFLDDELEVDEGEVFGVAFDLPLGRHLQLELLANRQDSRLRVRGGLFGEDLDLSDIEITYYHVGVLWQFLGGQANPYLVGSLGLARLAPDLPGIEDEDRPSLAIGGGVKIFAGRHVGFRIEGRGYYVALDEDDDDRWENEDSLTQAEATFGLILAW